MQRLSSIPECDFKFDTKCIYGSALGASAVCSQSLNPV